MRKLYRNLVFTGVVLTRHCDVSFLLPLFRGSAHSLSKVHCTRQGGLSFFFKNFQNLTTPSRAHADFWYNHRPEGEGRCRCRCIQRMSSRGGPARRVPPRPRTPTICGIADPATYPQTRKNRIKYGIISSRHRIVPRLLPHSKSCKSPMKTHPFRVNCRFECGIFVVYEKERS